MSSELDATEPVDVVRNVLVEAPADATYYLLDPPWEYVAALAEVGAEFDPDELPTLRLLSERGTLVTLRERFVAASQAANLVEADTLAVRERAGSADGPLIVGEDEVHAPLLADGTGAILSADEGSFLPAAREAAETAWETAEDFSLRTPALDRLRSTMDADLGDRFRDDFEASLSHVVGQRDVETAEFEAVTAAVLVAAKNETLHYDLSRWGEEVGLASKATFSRRKGELEDLGVVTTEKVPVEMGRPRQRLMLTDEYADALDDGGVEGLVGRVAV
ncbi:DUF5821 family protein [Halobaculum sp. MBLA0147]|uniref:transcriptional regulator TbsP domain-containing protein n=1 Tax=Halobaculum sp. MBLA0147 TaxID=3079934 RepID=UPI00352386F9